MSSEERKSTEGTHRGILKAATTVSSLTFLSRVLGLVRDILSAVIFGSGMVMDSFVLAFTVPNLFRRIFGEGALTSSFLPAAVKVRKEQGSEAAGILTSRVAVITGVLLFVTAALISAGAFIHFFRGGGSFEKNLTSILLTVLIFYLPFICVSAVLAAALNSVKHFALPAFAPVLLNLIWISVLTAASFMSVSLEVKAFILAGAIVAAGILQMIIQIPVLRKKGLRIAFRVKGAGKETAEVFRGMLPVVFALVVMQVNVLVDRLLAANLIDGHGAVSILFYGNRLMQFPLAIFGIAISVAVFPSLREYAVDGDRKNMWKTLNLGIRMLLFIIIPCSIGLIAAGGAVIDLFFNWGAFASSGDTAVRTYLVLAAYSVGLLFFCFNILVTKTYHSLDNRKFPAWVAGGMVLLNLGLNLAFLLLTDFREAGLALSTSITSFVNVMILLFYLVKKYGFDYVQGLLPAFVRTAAASVCMGLVAGGIAGVGGFSFFCWGTGWESKLLRVLSCVGGGSFVFLGIQYILKSSELMELLRIFRKKTAC